MSDFVWKLDNSSIVQHLQHFLGDLWPFWACRDMPWRDSSLWANYKRRTNYMRSDLHQGSSVLTRTVFVSAVDLAVLSCPRFVHANTGPPSVRVTIRDQIVTTRVLSGGCHWVTVKFLTTLSGNCCQATLWW